VVFLRVYLEHVNEIDSMSACNLINRGRHYFDLCRARWGAGLVNVEVMLADGPS
jgi:hypothetical protein